MKYGSATLITTGSDGPFWSIACEPFVAMRLKQVCSAVNKRAVGDLHLTHTPEHCRELLWFTQRYPLEVSPVEALTDGARSHEEHVVLLRDIIAGHVPPADVELALPPRTYQAKVATLARASGGLLAGDEVGLGKTVEGIAAISDPAYLPALVVAPNHLLVQWRDQLAKFAPKLRVWITPGTKATPLPEPRPDVVITSYLRLNGWARVLGEYVHAVVYDEVHELRRPDSKKYAAAQHLARLPTIRMRLGLSATPICNYGGELFHVFQTLAPGRLGSSVEFLREWCHERGGDKAIIRQPDAFGSWLRDQGLFIRHTRAEVGRELPPITTTVQQVECHTERLAEVGEQVRELARILLSSGTTNQERWRAGGELDWRLRQATGIAKAPFVADVVRLLVESGEPVLLAGWHRAVYDIWLDRFKAAGLRVACYTGEESDAEKQAARAAWIAGEIDVLIISLRSGAGLDGLQSRGSVVVVGELDWSPAVLEQLVGRLHRDGQGRPVMVYYLVTDDGADPVMAEALGLKRAQLDGVLQRAGNPIAAQRDGGHLKRLAAQFLKESA